MSERAEELRLKVGGEKAVLQEAGEAPLSLLVSEQSGQGSERERNELFAQAENSGVEPASAVGMMLELRSVLPMLLPLMSLFPSYHVLSLSFGL